jgi:hypothetical protein
MSGMTKWRVTVVVTDISEFAGQQLISKLLPPRWRLWSFEGYPPSSLVITLPVEETSEAAASDRALELVRKAGGVPAVNVVLQSVHEHTGVEEEQDAPHPA